MSFTGGKGDVAINDPLMALLGEPLDAMAQNLGQTNNGYVSANATNKVVSQGFTTGQSPIRIPAAGDRRQHRRLRQQLS